MQGVMASGTEAQRLIEAPCQDPDPVLRLSLIVWVSKGRASEGCQCQRSAAIPNCRGASENSIISGGRLCKSVAHVKGVRRLLQAFHCYRSLYTVNENFPAR